MKTTRRAGVLAAAGALLIGGVVPASAVEPDLEFVLDAGMACEFPLQVTGYGSGPQVYKEWTGADGTVRTLTAGKGIALTYTNMDTGAAFSTRANGGASRTSFAPDGTGTLEVTGHNVIFMFPTDDPGPSATVYTGRAVFDIAADGTWTLVSEHGGSVDICAELTG